MELALGWGLGLRETVGLWFSVDPPSWAEGASKLIKSQVSMTAVAVAAAVVVIVAWRRDF